MFAERVLACKRNGMGIAFQRPPAPGICSMSFAGALLPDTARCASFALRVNAWRACRKWCSASLSSVAVFSRIPIANPIVTHAAPRSTTRGGIRFATPSSL